MINDLLIKVLMILLGGIAISVLCAVFYFIWIIFLIHLKNNKKDNEDIIDWFI
jgi:hypothetical protein